MAQHASDAPVIVINQTQQKKHSMVSILVALAVVAALGVGGTFAYLTYTTNQATNQLTTSTGLQAQLVEANWDPDSATAMVPGTTVAKDPVIKNTSDSELGEWAAIEVEFKKLGSDGQYTTMTEDDLTALFKVYSIYSGTTAPDSQATDIAVNSNWEKMTNTSEAGKRFYYYKTAIAKDASTDSLFDNVAILKTASQEDITELNKLFTSWQIVVKGAAVQKLDSDTGANAFDATSGTPNWKTLLEASPATSTTSTTTGA